MKMRNPALFARIFNAPLMIHSMQLDAIIAGIGPRFGVDAPAVDLALTASGEKKTSNYQIIGNVAVIDVFGVLAHRSYAQADCTSVLGYDSVAKAIDAAITDGSVQGILLQMDSPGGEVSGAFELAQTIKDASAMKPIKAVISSLAASAAYLLASATQEIAISDTGMAGSIGVVMRHVDVSKMMADDGVSVTHIFAGAQKVDGNQFEPLSADVKARFQGDIDKLYSLFVNTVAAYRGVDAAAIRAQEAGIFTGQDAIKAGLADRIATPDQMLTDMQRSFSNSMRGISMDLTQLKPEHPGVYQAAFSEGAASVDAVSAVNTERARISAILNHEHAAGREAQAKVLALDTEMSVEQAAKVLAVSPVATVAASTNSHAFAAAMNGIKNANVGADDDDDSQSDQSNIAEGWGNAFAKVVPMRVKN